MAAETASGLAATHAPAGPGAAVIRAQAGAVACRSVTRTLRQRRLLILPVAFPLILFAINSSSLASASRLQGFPRSATAPSPSRCRSCSAPCSSP